MAEDAATRLLALRCRLPDDSTAEPTAEDLAEFRGAVLAAAGQVRGLGVLAEEPITTVDELRSAAETAACAIEEHLAQRHGKPAGEGWTRYPQH